MAMSVSNVYLHVVEDVINNVRIDFQSEGVDDNVLNELQSLWELKLVQSGAIQDPTAHDPLANPAAKPIPQTVATPVLDLNGPYVAAEEYETPPNDFPRVPASTSSREPVMFQYMPPGPSEESLQIDPGQQHLAPRIGNGTPSSYMQQPASWMNQKHRGVELNMNETYEEREGDTDTAQAPVAAPGAPPITKDFLTISTGKRKHDEISSGQYYIPQRDGAVDDELSTSMGETCENEGREVLGNWQAERSVGRSEDLRLWLQYRRSADAAIEQLIHAKLLQGLSGVAQLDGIDDEYDDAVAEDYNEPEDDLPVPEAKIAVNAEPTESEGSEPPLCEDDDEDDVDDADRGDDEPDTNHLVLAQFDKVTRSKNKWKCTLKDGIMHLNNRDILFVKATGEFEF